MGCAGDKRLRQLSLFDQEGVRDTKSVPKEFRAAEAQTWRFMGHEFRVIEVDGDPWFIAREVCDVLGLTNPSKATRDLDGHEKGITSSYTLGGRQEMLIISESGFYELVNNSRKPIAKEFRRFVRQEVLPAIRKTGKYEVPKEPDSIDCEASRLRSDRITAKARLENRENNGKFMGAAKRRGAKDPREYAGQHNAGYRGAFGKNASELKQILGIRKDETPLDHMDAIALGVLDMGKLIALKQQEINPNSTPEDLADDYERATRGVMASTLHQLNNNPEGVRFGVGVEQDPRLGKVIAVSPLALTDDR